MGVPSEGSRATIGLRPQRDLDGIHWRKGAWRIFERLMRNVELWLACEHVHAEL